MPSDGTPQGKPYIISTLFNPAIVWDTSRLAIAKKMSDEERSAISKRATSILRDSMPEILPVLTTYEVARSQYAHSVILQKLEKQELLTESAIKQSAKSRQRAVQNLQQIDAVTQKYQTQFGYRMACLSLMVEDTTRREMALAALEDLHHLSGVQQVLFQGLLLEDLIRWSNYYAQKYADYDVQIANAGYVKKINARSATISQSLESLTATDKGRGIGPYLDEERAKNPVLNGTDTSKPGVTATTEFALVRDCFKRLNEYLSTRIVQKTNDTKSESDDWNINILQQLRKAE